MLGLLSYSDPVFAVFVVLLFLLFLQFFSCYVYLEQVRPPGATQRRGDGRLITQHPGEAVEQHEKEEHDETGAHVRIQRV